MISTGSTVSLSFSSFGTEQGYDFVRVYEGSSSTGTQLGSFSGSSVPSAVTARSGSMYVVFTADSSAQGAGFGDYIFIEAARSSPVTLVTLASNSAGPLYAATCAVEFAMWRLNNSHLTI